MKFKTNAEYAQFGVDITPLILKTLVAALAALGGAILLGGR